MEKVGDERLERETERFEHLGEEENKKKQAKTSDSSGESKASASSSGPAVPDRKMPRNRGGVPMSTDSGDSVPEIVSEESTERKEALKTETSMLNE